MLFYRANSQMYLSNCLIRVVLSQNLVQRGYGDDSKDEIEIVRDSASPHSTLQSETSSLMEGIFCSSSLSLSQAKKHQAFDEE